MGKKLIFKGADFSTNALEHPITYTDITSLFSFTNGKAYIANTSSSNLGNLSNSTTFKYASADVSQYAGKTIKITFCNFTTSGGAQSGYGNVSKDSNSSVITSGCWPFPKNGNTGPSLALYQTEVTLPSNIHTLCVTYAQSDSSLSFSCLVKNNS